MLWTNKGFVCDFYPLLSLISLLAEIKEEDLFVPLAEVIAPSFILLISRKLFYIFRPGKSPYPNLLPIKFFLIFFSASNFFYAEYYLLPVPYLGDVLGTSIVCVLK
jgi:hypothetical protein